MCRCRFNLYEPVEFISRHLMDKLEWTKVRDNVAVHVPCSSKKMGIEAAFNAVAGKCSHQITSSDVPCCGEHPHLLLAHIWNVLLMLCIQLLGFRPRPHSRLNDTYSCGGHVELAAAAAYTITRPVLTLMC